MSEIEKVSVRLGDCLEVLATLPENSVDSVVTDPPYHFTSIVKRFGKEGSAPAQYGTDGAFARASRGFMGKEWDGGDIAFRPETWAAVMRVLKPGGHMVAFGAPKNYHRLACAIEDAGFEIRDSLMWVFGSGFPKTKSALKPAYEPVVLARKPLSEGTVAANVLRWGTGAINVGATKVGSEILSAQKAGQAKLGTFERSEMVTPEREGRWPANLAHDGSDEVLEGFPSEGANSPARFFYCAKANKHDRAGSKHPTVKPVALMQWLVRMVTPPGGTVLDPFAGSGTTGQAAINESFPAILIEREQEYYDDIIRRLTAASSLKNLLPTL